MANLRTFTGDVDITSNILMNKQLFIRAHDTTSNSIAIGIEAGDMGQGVNAMAIGYKAGKTVLHSNTIVLNASGQELNTVGVDRLYVKPIRRTFTESSNILTYTNSGEIIENPNLKISSDGDTNLSSNLHVGGTGNFTSSEESTGIDSGALRVSGGVGINSNLHVGGTGNFTSSEDSTSIDSGALRVSGGVSIAKKLYVGGSNITFGPTDTSSYYSVQTNGGLYLRGANSTSSGSGSSTLLMSGTGSGECSVSLTPGDASTIQLNVGNATRLQVLKNGNVGIGTTNPQFKLDVHGSSNVGILTATTGIISSTMDINSTDDATGSNNGSGALRVAGGAGIAEKLYVGGVTSITNTTASTSTTTGALIVSGGVGVAEKLYVGGVTNITNTTASTSTTTGALIVSGGVGVGGDVNVSGSTNVAGNINANGSDITGNIIVTGGNIGIGTTQPHAPLTVYGIGGSLTGGTARTYFTPGILPINSGSGWSASSTSDDLGIYSVNTISTNNAFVSMNGTFGASDERIKKDITDIDDGSALDTLRLLKPKQYKYKDYIRRGTDPVWGFIAQEVRDTLPYATQTRFECIPNIYELSNVSDSNVITFTNFDTSSLVSSNVMVLKVYDKDDKEHLINIIEVLNDHSIRVDEDLSEWSGTMDGNEGEKIFVYGQQVNDFIYIKKESIWTVAAAALQEVDRQLQAEKTKVSTLETQLASVLTRLDALENT